MVNGKLWTPGQPLQEQKPKPLLYLLVCGQCPTKRDGSAMVIPFEAEADRNQFTLDHRNWTGHSAFMAREEPKP